LDVNEPEDLKDRPGYRRWGLMVPVLFPGGARIPKRATAQERDDPSHGRPNAVFAMSDNQEAWQPAARGRPVICRPYIGGLSKSRGERTPQTQGSFPGFIPPSSGKAIGMEITPHPNFRATVGETEQPAQGFRVIAAVMHR